MTMPDRGKDGSLSPSLQRRVHAVCERFEVEWKAGQRPLIEKYLGDVPEPDRSELLRKLLALDLEYRIRSGDQPALAEYLARLPAHGELVHTAFAELQVPGDRHAVDDRVVETVSDPQRTGPEVHQDESTVDASPTSLRTDSPAVPGHEILTVLGRGGMGIVYQARHMQLKRLVALKMIRPDAGANQEQLARFQSEARAVARLQHPHIVQIHEIGEHGGQPYFSLELVDGGSLAQKLGGTPLPNLQAAELVETLARAVHAAHQQGVVHRDLKPANVLLASDGQPKITDFGLAKRLDDDTGQTQSGIILGTPSYMAPEQAVGQAHEVGPLVDVYALGAILYECLTGRPPFRAATVLETLEQVRSQDPVPPRQLNPAVNRELETIALKCLRKEPERRYGSAEELAHDLRRHLAGEPIMARPVGLPERAWLWARRRPALAALLLVSAAAALLSIALLINRSALRQREQERDLEQTARQNAEERERLEVRAKEEAQRREQIEATARKDAQEREKTEASLRKQAETAGAEAVRLREVAEAALNPHRILLAYGEWHDNQVTRAEARLDDCPEPFRNWEWHYLKRLCHTDLLTVPTERNSKGILWNAALSPDGSRLAWPGRFGRIIVWDVVAGRAAFTLQGHRFSVAHVAFSPDGKRLVSAGQDNTVRLWDLTTGQEERVLEGHAKEVVHVAFSPDGSRLASASSDRTVKVWDVGSGQEVLSLKVPGTGVQAVAFSPDGKQLASGGSDLRLWDVTTGQEVQVFKRHPGWINSVAFSPSGKYLASGSRDGMVRVWNPATGEAIHTLQGHSASVLSVAFSSDGKHLATASGDSAGPETPGEIKLWNPHTGQVLLNLRGHRDRVYSVAFSRDGRRLLSASDDKTVKVWDPAAGQETASLSGYTSPVYCLAFSPDGKRLASACQDGTVRVWDTARRQCTLTVTLTVGDHVLFARSLAFSPDGKRLAACTEKVVRVWDATTGEEHLALGGHAGLVQSVAFSPIGPRLASACTSGVVKVWDAATGREEYSLKGVSVCFSPDGRRLATALNPSTVQLWDAASGKEVRTLKRGFRKSSFMRGGSPSGETNPIILAFSSDGTRLALAGWEEVVPVWDTTTGEEVFLLPGHTGGSLAVTFSPDSKRLASAGFDRVARLWDVTTGQEALVLRGNGFTVSFVAFSPDGKLLASAGSDAAIRLWDATPVRAQDARLALGEPSALEPPRPLTEVRRLAGHTTEVSGVAWSSDGKQLASAGADQVVRIWNANSGQALLTLRGHAGPVRTVAFNPAGRFLASAGMDKAVRLWDATTGKETATLNGHTDGINCLAFSPDGARLASGGQDRVVKVWNTGTGKEVLTLEGHTRPVHGVTFGAGDKQLVSTDADFAGKVWDLDAGRELSSFGEEDRGRVVSLAVSPDGRRLAWVGGDGEIKFRYVRGGQESLSLRHTGLVQRMTFSPDGRLLASSSMDGTVKVWDTTNGRELFFLKGQGKRLTSLAFHPDGTRLAAGCGNLVIVWAAPVPQPLENRGDR